MATKKQKTQKKKVPKGLRKKFFPVSAPLTKSKIHLYGYAPEYLQDRYIKIDLTKSLRGKNLELKIKTKLENDDLKGELVSLELLKTYIRRTIRKGTDYVEDSFKIEAKDGKLIIKPLLVTRKRVSRAVRKALRENAKKFLMAKAKLRTSEELFTEVMTNKLQKELAQKLKKVYPLALSEIRIIEILEKTQIKSKEEKPKTEKETKTKEESKPKEEKPKEEKLKKETKKETKSSE